MQHATVAAKFRINDIPHRYVANTNGIVFLWIGVQVEHHKAAGFFHDAAGKAAIVALAGDHGLPIKMISAQKQSG